MLIFKVMVCFLAVFTSEDCVGGLPTIQDSPDNHQAGQSAKSASNQGITNEPGSHSRELLDYAERHEEEFRRKVNPEIKMIRINSGRILSAKIPAGKFEEKFSPRILSAREKGADRQLLKFRLDAGDENENIRRDGLREGSSTLDQFLDKSKSRKDEATSSEFPVSSHGENEGQRFSSVYAEAELDKKVNKNEEEFENNLSTYLADAVSAKAQITAKKSGPELKIGNSEAEEKAQAPNASNNSGKEAAGNLLSGKTQVPVPGEEAGSSMIGVADFSPENRQRKSVGDVTTWHQQSTNMRPTRTQHLVQNKRSPGEGTHLKLPGYGGRRSVAKIPSGIEAVNPGQNRRQFTADGSSSLVGNQLRFSGLTPVQINAAIAYSNRQPPAQALNIDLSRALYQFGPAQLHALKGVFDKVPPSTKNFKPIAPKQVAYVPPRIIYDTKIVPTAFMPFRTEQKTVEALSALLGQDPAQQLQGFNLILRKDAPEKNGAKFTPAVPSVQGISRQGGIHDSLALSQTFVTPIPSIDINSGLADGPFRFSQDGRELQEEVEVPFDQITPQYPLPENIGRQEDPYKIIPIVEEQEGTQRGQELEKEQHPALGGVEILETTHGENEGRYSHQHNEEGEDHGDAYAAKYSFGYHVKDYANENNFGHEETRDGIITEGRYHVLLPDGRLQNVKYHVDEGGYHAKVSYQSNHSI